MFRLVIRYDSADEGVNEGVNGKKYLLEIIQKTEGLKVNELALRIDKSNKTVERYIRDLKKDGLIEFKGAPKTGGYYLKRGVDE